MDDEKMLEMVQELDKRMHSFKRKQMFPRDKCNSGLNPSEHYALRVLHSINGGQKVMPSKLAKEMKVTLAAVTQQLKALEEHGYVERRLSKSDRRRMYVSITEKGFELFESMRSERIKFMSGLINYLGEEDGKKLVELMTKAINYIEDISQQG